MEIKNNQIVRSKEQHLLNCLAFGVAAKLLAHLFNTDMNTVIEVILNEAQEQFELARRKPGMIDHMINEQLNLQNNHLNGFVIEFDVEDLEQ